MKCTQDEKHICDNMDMKKCGKCTCSMLCLCTRPEVQEMVRDLWEKSTEKEPSKSS